MKFGNITIYISEDGELTLCREGLSLGGRTTLVDSDLIRSSRFLVRLCRKISERGGKIRNGYLHAICEKHTFPALSRLGRETGATINEELRLVTWRNLW